MKTQTTKRPPAMHAVIRVTDEKGPRWEKVGAAWPGAEYNGFDVRFTAAVQPGQKVYLRRATFKQTEQ